MTGPYAHELEAHDIIEAMLSGAPQSDDVAVLLLCVQGSPTQEADLALAAVPESAPVVRRHVRRFAQTHHLNADTTFRLLYVAGEAVANAVEHARNPAPDSLCVSLRRAVDAVELTVSDRGLWKMAPSEHRGRGLPMMRDLCKELDVERTSNGTCVRARFLVSLESAD